MEVWSSWEVGHWQHASKGYIQSLVPTFLPASCLTLDKVSSAESPYYNGIWPHYVLRINEAKDCG